jgi:hypothetical protein
MYLDNSTRSIKGVALQEGNFTFRIQIDATGCDPAGTTNELFHWAISAAEAPR